MHGRTPIGIFPLAVQRLTNTEMVLLSFKCKDQSMEAMEPQPRVERNAGFLYV